MLFCFRANVSLRIVSPLFNISSYVCDTGFEPTFVNCIKPENMSLSVWYQCDFGSTNKIKGW